MQLSKAAYLPKRVVTATPSKNPFAFKFLMTILIVAGVVHLFAKLYPKQFFLFMDFMFNLIDVAWFYLQKFGLVVIAYIGGLGG